MTIALFIGRFQPFHKGHLWAVKHILKDCNTVIIGIGSSQYRRTAQNPFSSDERKEIIIDALKHEAIGNYSIFLLPDINQDGEWVNHVKKIIPKFDVVYTGSLLSKQLFEKQGYVVKLLPRMHDISASELRLRVLKKMDWKSFVVNPRVLEEMGVSQIIKNSGPHEA